MDKEKANEFIREVLDLVWSKGLDGHVTGIIVSPELKEAIDIRPLGVAESSSDAPEGDITQSELGSFEIKVQE